MRLWVFLSSKTGAPEAVPCRKQRVRLATQLGKCSFSRPSGPRRQQNCFMWTFHGAHVILKSYALKGRAVTKLIIFTASSRALLCETGSLLPPASARWWGIQWPAVRVGIYCLGLCWGGLSFPDHSLCTIRATLNTEKRKWHFSIIMKTVLTLQGSWLTLWERLPWGAQHAAWCTVVISNPGGWIHVWPAWI